MPGVCVCVCVWGGGTGGGGARERGAFYYKIFCNNTNLFCMRFGLSKIIL